MNDDKSSTTDPDNESAPDPVQESGAPNNQDEPEQPAAEPEADSTPDWPDDDEAAAEQPDDSPDTADFPDTSDTAADPEDSETVHGAPDEAQATGAQSPAEPETAAPGSTTPRPATPDILDELATRNKPGQSGRRRKKSRLSAPGSRGDTRARSTATRRKTGSSAVLVLLLLLPLLAAIAWLAWQQVELRDTLAGLRQNNQSLEDSLEQTRAALAEQPRQEAAPVDSARFDEIEASLRQEIAALRQQLGEMGQQVGQLESEQVVSSVAPDFAWKVFEAEYLVNQASQKLELEADVAAAISLLQRADQALVDSEKSGVFTAREAISAALIRLRSFEALDRNGLYLRLDNLAGTISELDLLSSMRQNFVNQRTEQATPVDMTESDSGPLASTLDFLSEVFVWREWEDRPEALLPPGEESLIKQGLRLSLKQAQIGLLNRDQQLYRQSLEEARRTLNRYAVTGSPGGAAVLEEMAALAEVDVDQPLPQLTQTVTAVQQLAASER